MTELYKNLFENFQSFLNQEEINEVTDEELTHIDDVLHNLKAEDLSFNNIFGDRMRIVEPMLSKDTHLDTLKTMLTKSGYTPDFSTGLATYHVLSVPPGTSPAGKPTPGKTTVMPPQMYKGWSQSGPAAMKFVKKRQIKIGKLLQKGARLYDMAHKAWKTSDELQPEDFGIEPDWNPADADDTAKVDKYREAAEKAAAESKKDREKLTATFPDMTSHPSGMNALEMLGQWWSKKSTFYRENPGAAQSGLSAGENSIIYSRHPIDVLRMSDFDRIESCHSPASRGGGASYYKCAVAEAHAHGFIAYVVRNSDLNRMKTSYLEGENVTHQELLDAVEGAEEELFRDSDRLTGDIEPLSRLRIKKYTNPPLDVALAVPEDRVYGTKFPNFQKSVTIWAKEKQPEAIKRIEGSKDSDNPYESAFDKDGTALDLGNWERHGGTYQDTSDSALFYNLLGYKTVGQAHVDTSTEDNLPSVGVIEQWQDQVDGYKDNYNRRMSHIQITRANVEDDGAGEAYIEVAAELMLVFDETTFKESAFQDVTRKAIEYLPQELIDYGYQWLSDYVTYTTINDSSQDWASIINRIQDEEKNQVVVKIPIDIEHINPEGGGYAYSPDNFQEIAEKIDEADDAGDGIQELAVSYLKRNGIVDGGKLHELANVLENESWYEWSYEVDDEYNPTHIELTTNTYVNYNDLIKQIPVKLDTSLKTPTRDFTATYDGTPIAHVETFIREDDNVRVYRVHSEEFGGETGMEVANKTAVLEYIQWEIAKLILKPPFKHDGHWNPGDTLRASRDYAIAVRVLLRDIAGGKEGEFLYPDSKMMVSGPDSDDEFGMKFIIELDDDDPDAVVESAHQIILEADDEDILKEIFRTAFTKAAKLPSANLEETRKYFKKFNLW
tara:strand:- start:20707 stop:23382 length:2676 start_codon:yes stop_codon:yes gene_type:complete